MNARSSLVAAAVAAALLSGCGGADSPPATMPTPPTPDQLHAPVMMGDSITAYWSGDNQNIPLATTIYQLVPDVMDAGIPGNTTGAMLSRFHADALAYTPNVVVILGGTNDVLSGNADVSAEAQMVNDAQAAGVPVILCTIPASPMLNQAAVQQWNAQVAALAASTGAKLVDYYSATLTNGQPDVSLFFSDREHPNANGYARMWSVLQAALAADGIAARAQ